MRRVNGVAPRLLILKLCCWRAPLRTTVPVKAVAGPVLPARSETAPEASRIATPPYEQPLAVTVITVPVEEEGVKVQPVALLALEKSAEVSPVISSLNVNV